MIQSQEDSKGPRIIKIEDTSPENLPVMCIVDNQESEQCNYESTVPLEKSSKEDHKCQSVLGSPEKTQFLENNPPTLLHVEIPHPEEPILEEPQIPENPSITAMDRNQPPDKDHHEWPDPDQEADKMKGYTSALDPPEMKYSQITSPSIIFHGRIRHPPCFKTPKTSIISHTDCVMEEGPVEVRSRMKAHRQPSDYGILEDEEINNKIPTSTAPNDHRLFLPIHQPIEVKFGTKKRARIKAWDPMDTSYNTMGNLGSLADQ
jgi:hypothetical protein